MSKINNYEELVAERRRLETDLQKLIAVLKTEMNAMRVKLEPLGDLISFSGIQGKKEAGTLSLLKAVVSIGIDLLARDNLLVKAGWMARVLFPAVLKSISKQFIAKKPILNNNLSSD